jgi:hypothetical protein
VDEAPPKVTPWLLQRADDLCPRRLRRTFEGAPPSHDPVHRSRLREPFLARLREIHAELGAPVDGDFAGLGAELEPEEQIVLAQAAHWYVRVFGDRPAAWEDADVDAPTVRRQIRVGGWVDLTVLTPDGPELRQCSLWSSRSSPADPLDLPALRVACLRLTPWLAGRPLRVVWADLVEGQVSERVVDPAERAELTEWFDGRLAVLQERIEDPVAVPGADCGGCGYVSGCPEHRKGALWGRRRDLLPGIVHLTPTNVDTWKRCRREWRNRHLFQIPASDADPGPVHGRQLHDVLRLVHAEGSCHDAAHVADVLERHAFADDARVAAEIARHERRCPSPVEHAEHEVTKARFFPHPTAPFMATARIDALWLRDDGHGAVLDAHDYKTGQVWSDRVADDAQGRLQAWVLAPLAERLGTRLRITFEHLAAEVADDPLPFEPDADDLAAIGAELHSTVTEIRAESEWAGVADAEVCRHCAYRSICPDSQAPAAPVWPRIDDDLDVDASA